MDQQANVVGVLKMWAGRPGAQPRPHRSMSRKPRPAQAQMQVQAQLPCPWGDLVCTD